MIREFAELTVDLPVTRMSVISDTQTDSELISRTREGDLAAFDRLMELHQQRALVLAWRMLGNREDAKDAVQDSFLKAYTNLGKFDSRHDFAGWLYRIVINTCRDQVRRRRPVESFDADIAEPLSSSPDSEAALLDQEKQRLLMSALETLSRKERAAIVLRDFEGLSTERVAEILGSSPVTVRSQISAARTKMIGFIGRLMKK